MSADIQQPKKRKPRPQDFKPGQSGNPAGRPPLNKTVTEMLREKIDKEIVLRVIKKKIIAGDSRILEMYINRIEGKVPDTIIQISNIFKASDEENQKNVKWLRKYHPKLLPEYLKLHGVKKPE